MIQHNYLAYHKIHYTQILIFDLDILICPPHKRKKSVSIGGTERHVPETANQTTNRCYEDPRYPSTCLYYMVLQFNSFNHGVSDYTVAQRMLK